MASVAYQIFLFLCFWLSRRIDWWIWKMCVLL